jgi:phosphoribosylanthranilate isomerase
MIKVKICGLTTPEAVDAALDGGAAFLGFMFFAASPRNISPEAAARLAQRARGRAAIVAVTAGADDALMRSLAVILRPDYVQLHAEDGPARARQVRQICQAGVIKGLSVSRASDLDAAADFEGVADYLMFDARPPEGADRPGGHGASFDWTILSRRRFGRPWFLAGGLTPENVEEAVRISGAPMADVSSGVEREPGLKDPALIRAFLEAARRA